uniref:HSF-type DNA-binding domain-containing protein n=1 Tax=Strigops habroptila TaxID=2489341 RepID=A0A672U7N5_STRHB
MEGQRLPGAVNPNHFPGKLWLLVNSPRCGSVRWDARGEGLLIDQRLFERELLGAGPAGDGAAVSAAFFKTRNFPSFIRQLNLYGFRKLGPGPAGGAAGRGSLQGLAGGDGGSSAGPLLHFQSPHFRRDRPELLVRLKRLTSANKAKLAAGLEVPSRPPQRSRRLLGTANAGCCAVCASAPLQENGLVTVGQVHQPARPDSFFPYSNRAASCQNPTAFPTKTFQQTPVPSRTWQGSFGLLPGHGASLAFPGQGAPFPILHKCSTEVTYTLQTVFSLLPLQRGAPTGAASLPQHGSCVSPGQCSRAPDPTPTLQCCSPPAQGEPLTASVSAAAPAYTDCGFVQPPSAAECLPSDGAHHASDEEKKMEELSFEDVFQFLNEMCASSSTDIVTLEPVESEMSTPQSNRSHPLLVDSGNSDTPSAVEESQLAPLTPAAADTSFLMEAAQALTSAEVCDGELFVSYTNVSIESAAAAAEMVQDSVTTQEAPEGQREQLDHCPAQLPEMFVLEGLFSAEQVSAKGSEAVTKPVEEPGSPLKPQCRKRRHSSHEGKSLVRDSTFFRDGQDSCSETLPERGDQKS